MQITNKVKAMKISEIASTIEHTLLSPTCTDRDVDRAVGISKEYGFAGVCVPPFWVKRASRDLVGSSTKLVTVAGFPLGYHMTETKLEEIKLAIRDGANEIDMVINVSAFLIGFPWVKIELAKAAQLCHEHEVLLKVIIETAYLDKDGIFKACKWCEEAGADMVKSSTGFAREGATVEKISWMKEAIGNRIGIKASGGISDHEQAIALLSAGATRIGTSNGPALLKA
jgi:deoxyribose-phosphate aldolase